MVKYEINEGKNTMSSFSVFTTWGCPKKRIDRVTPKCQDNQQLGQLMCFRSSQKCFRAIYHAKTRKTWDWPLILLYLTNVPMSFLPQRIMKVATNFQILNQDTFALLLNLCRTHVKVVLRSYISGYEIVAISVFQVHFVDSSESSVEVRCTYCYHIY